MEVDERNKDEKNEEVEEERGHIEIVQNYDGLEHNKPCKCQTVSKFITEYDGYRLSQDATKWVKSSLYQHLASPPSCPLFCALFDASYAFFLTYSQLVAALIYAM